MHKYSILRTLESYRGGSGTFEFRLVYPGLAGNNVNRWTQTSNPTNSSGFVTGYNATSIGQPGTGNDQFTGLSELNNGNSFIRGELNGGSYWFSIGATTAYSNVGFPGPSSILVQWVQLWVIPSSVPSRTLVSCSISASGTLSVAPNVDKTACIFSGAPSAAAFSVTTTDSLGGVATTAPCQAGAPHAA